MEAIQSATVVSAKLLKAENEIGQLAPILYGRYYCRK